MKESSSSDNNDINEKFFNYACGIMEKARNKSEISRVDIVLLILLWVLTIYTAVAEKQSSDEDYISKKTKFIIGLTIPITSGMISLVKTIQVYIEVRDEKRKDNAKMLDVIKQMQKLRDELCREDTIGFASTSKTPMQQTTINNYNISVPPEPSPIQNQVKKFLANFTNRNPAQSASSPTLSSPIFKQEKEVLSLTSASSPKDNERLVKKNKHKKKKSFKQDLPEPKVFIDSFSTSTGGSYYSYDTEP